MVYKLLLALFWLGFWIGLVQDRLYWANVRMIFPDYATKGCPSHMSAFWADVCLGFIFIIELTLMHAVFFTAVLYVDFFVLQDKYGFLKMD